MAEIDRDKSDSNEPSSRSASEADYLIPTGMSGPVIVRGSGADVFDTNGKRYLDLEGGPGVVSVGHCHPRVVEAIVDQAGILTQGPGRYPTVELLKLARRLAALTGDRLRRSFFANSGAEANDGAIKLAIKHAVKTGKSGFGIIALEHAFHGRLSLPLSLTGMSERKRGLGPYASFPGIVRAPAPYCYRCPLGLAYPSCGVRCADVIEESLQTSTPGEAAIMIAEPVLGVGGIIVPPDEYWPKVQAICDRHHITLICDEVFTGFGRTGRMFAHDHWGSKPGIVTFAKALGGGVPFGGFIATEEVGTAFEPGDHFTTFGANNLIGVRVANTVLDIVDQEELPGRARARGEQFRTGFASLAQRHLEIGDFRGMGLLLGIEIVRDRETRTPDPRRTQQIQRSLRDQGILASVTGVHHCVLRITPPLVIDEDQVDHALEALDAAFTSK